MLGFTTTGLAHHSKAVGQYASTDYCPPHRVRAAVLPPIQVVAPLAALFGQPADGARDIL